MIEPGRIKPARFFFAEQKGAPSSETSRTIILSKVNTRRKSGVPCSLLSRHTSADQGRVAHVNHSVGMTLCPIDIDNSQISGRPRASRASRTVKLREKGIPTGYPAIAGSARRRPLEADSLFYLGMSQVQTRQKSEAQGVLNQALLAGLKEPLATEAKRALADLER
jgi:hypothetical protein